MTGSKMSQSQGSSFQAIQEYFQRQSCRYCYHPFAADGVQLLREEPGIMVVRVSCLQCQRPLGVAIVGTNNKKNQEKKPTSEWTKKDTRKFEKLPAITYDDVLAAHQFFDSLGSDWTRHLGK